MDFLYKKLSKKRLEQFRPSKTLGDELRIQRNYYDITSSTKTTTSNKSAILNSFLKNIDNKEILDRMEDIKELDKYLDDKYKKVTSAEINVPSRITELEKELNPKLKKFTRSNYFTSYYCLFRIYVFLDFNIFLKLLKNYDVKYKYSDIKVLELPKNYKPEFNILASNRCKYNFYSFLVPFIKMLNEQEQVEISLNIGEPSYFIKEILDKKITTITYDTAKKLLEVLDVRISGEHTLDEFLKEFNILDNKTFMEEKEFEEHIIEQDYQIYMQEQELIPLHFGYIYDKDSYNNFTFVKDLNEMLNRIYSNLQKYVDDSLSNYNIDVFLNVFKLLTNLKCLTDDIKESEKLLKLPLKDDIEKIFNLYNENISKEYYSIPQNITLLDPVEFNEEGEEETLSVCIPKLKIDFSQNSEKYNFSNYFKGIYTKKK